jgi:TM2 domain-containing membrane protein YozV
MPHSLGGAAAAIVIGILLVAYLAGLATGVVATLLFWLGWILIVLGIAAVIYLLVNGRGRARRGSARL